MTWDEHYRGPFQPLLAGVTFAPTDDPSALDRLVTDKTAAIIVEPIQGEGGVRPISPALAKAIEKACQRTGALLIADEIQCGTGRTGQMFAFPALGLTPDLVSVAKALGGGFPIGAALVADNVAATIAAGDHGTTYGGNLLACRAALDVLDALDGGLLDHVAAMGAGLRARPARDGRAPRHRRRGPRQGPDVGRRSRPRRRRRRPGRARPRPRRQPHVGLGRSACCRPTSSPKRRSPKASGCSRPRCRGRPWRCPWLALLCPLTDRRRARPAARSTASLDGAEPAEIRRATVADAPAILALIDANLAAGHLLPRTRRRRDASRRALPRRRRSTTPSSAAPSSRRSAAPSPKCARWSSTRAAAAAASARASSRS